MTDDLIARAEQLIADDCLPLTSKLTKQLVDRIKELEADNERLRKLNGHLIDENERLQRRLGEIHLPPPPTEKT